MSDVLLRLLLPAADLKVSVVKVSGVCREAAQLHSLRDASAAMLAYGVAGAALMSTTLKGEERINLQLECDGPLHGLFVDAGADGSLRGYVKNPNLGFALEGGAFQWRPLLGNSGFVSVLSPQPDGEYYRSSVELVEFSVAGDLQRYFDLSDQVATRLALHVAQGPEGVTHVGGVLIQALPNGDTKLLEKLGLSLNERVVTAVNAGADADALAAAVLDGVDAEPMLRTTLAWKCTCSKERVLKLLQSMGKAELQDMLEKQGGAKVSCHFCGRGYEATGDDLRVLLAADTPQA